MDAGVEREKERVKGWKREAKRIRLREPKGRFRIVF